MLFNKISLVLALEVCAPAYRVFPLDTSRLKNLDTFSICKTNEFCVCHTFKTSDEFIVKSVIEELDVIIAVVKGILHEILDELLCEVHVILDVVERHLRFDHPELCEVSWSI